MRSARSPLFGLVALHRSLHAERRSLEIWRDQIRDRLSGDLDDAARLVDESHLAYVEKLIASVDDRIAGRMQ